MMGYYPLSFWEHDLGKVRNTDKLVELLLRIDIFYENSIIWFYICKYYPWLSSSSFGSHTISFDDSALKTLEW